MKASPSERKERKVRSLHEVRSKRYDGSFGGSRSSAHLHDLPDAALAHLVHVELALRHLRLEPGPAALVLVPVLAAAVFIAVVAVLGPPGAAADAGEGARDAVRPAGAARGRRDAHRRRVGRPVVGLVRLGAVCHALRYALGLVHRLLRRPAQELFELLTKNMEGRINSVVSQGGPKILRKLCQFDSFTLDLEKVDHFTLVQFVTILNPVSFQRHSVPSGSLTLIIGTQEWGFSC